VAPLIETERGPNVISEKRPSTPVLSGATTAVLDDGRQQVAESGTAAVNMLEFFRVKILQLETQVGNLTALCEGDHKLLQDTATKVGRIANILEAAASSMYVPEERDFESSSKQVRRCRIQIRRPSIVLTVYFPARDLPAAAKFVDSHERNNISEAVTSD
jgi:hypothetical protein